MNIARLFVILFTTMDIKYLGHSSFFIKTKNAKIVTDPYGQESTGMKFPKTEADIVTISHDHGDHNYVEGIKGEPLILTWPGEYEKNEVRITGFGSFHDSKGGIERGSNVMYKFEDNDISVLHCGDLGHLLNDEITEQIGAVDILMVPVGGFFTITAEEAVKVVNQIEPSMVIPMHYNQPGLNQETFANLQDLSVFLKEIGAEDVQPTDKITVKKDQLNPESTRVIVLSI